MVRVRALRVAWVTSESPDRRLGGGNIRQSYLLEAVARAFPTDLLLAGPDPDEVVAACVQDLVTIPKRTPAQPVGVRRKVHDLLRSVQPGPSVEEADEAPARADLARLLAARPGYDLLCVEHSGLTPLVLGRADRQRWVATLHTVGSARADQAAAVAPGGRQRWVRQREAAQARRLERQVLQRYDRVAVCSPLDADRLVDVTGDPRAVDRTVRVVPNGVDTARFGALGPRSESPSLVLTASLDYEPNVDGIGWFLAEVWPLLTAQVPGVTLSLVGRRPVPEVLAAAERPGVTVHADVPDVLPHVAAARVLLVPLRLGSGTRLKVLEGLASGRPVVSTTIGAEGIAATDELFLADDPAGFAAAVVRALGPAGDLVTAKARHLVRGSYDWTTVGAAWVSELAALL